MGVVGEDGPTHHGVFDIGYLRMIPNMICMAPKDKDELQEMLNLAISLKQPVSIRYPRGKAISLNISSAVEMAKAQVINEGKDICIISVGTMFSIVMGAQQELKNSGIETMFVNARFIKPLDEELLREIAKKCSLIVTVEDNVLTGGFGSAVKEFLGQENLLNNTRVLSLGFPDQFIPSAAIAELFKLYKLDAVGIAESIKKSLSKV